MKGTPAYLDRPLPVFFAFFAAFGAGCDFFFPAAAFEEPAVRALIALATGLAAGLATGLATGLAIGFAAGRAGSCFASLTGFAGIGLAAGLETWTGGFAAALDGSFAPSLTAAFRLSVT